MTRTRMTRRRGRALFGSALWAALLLSGCGGDTEDETAETPEAGETAETTEDDDGDETRTFEADNGDIEIPTDPQNIVAIGNAVGTVVDLGAEPVGVTESTTNTAVRWFSPEGLEAYEAAEKVGSGDPDVEAVASLEPDLIVIAVPQEPWEQNFAHIEDRFQSIAPTVFIANNAEEWDTVSERLADAVGRSDAFGEQKDEYEQLVADMQEEFSSVLESTTFAQLNRYPSSDEGSLDMEYASNWCTWSPTEVGFDFPESPDGEPSVNMSMEQLSELADYDVLLYPLEADDEPREEFAPVLESNSWEALPQVTSGRALGVQCPSGIGTYSAEITQLESLSEALRTLPEAG